MIKYNQCWMCDYYIPNKRYDLLFDDRYKRGCKRCGTTSDEYDAFNKLVYIGDKSCFLRCRQMSMEELFDE